MAKFDQRGQTVTYQYNADSINFGNVQSRADVLVVLQQLQEELAKAKSANVAPEEAIVDAESSMAKAIIEAKKPAPEKGKVTSYLESASKLIGGAAALGGLVLAIEKAASLVSKFL